MSIGIDFTTTALINGAKLRASVPSSQSLFLDTDFITLLNNHMVSIIIPLIKSVNEEYFVEKSDVTLVSGTSEYSIPTRALGGALRDVVMVDSNGRELELPRLEPELVKYGGGYYSQRIFGVYIQNDKIVFYPSMSNAPAGSSVRFRIERRPNDLCLTSNAAKITSITTATNTITVSNVPSAWGTTTTLDLIDYKPQFDTIEEDMTIASISSLDIELSSLPTGIAVGQWVSESLTTPIAQLPYEAHKLIEQLGAISILESLKDTEGLANARKTYELMKDSFYKIITPRIEGSPKKVINRNSVFDYNRGWNGYLTIRP